MFFFKSSRLAKYIKLKAVATSENLYDYFRNDALLAKCINEVPFKVNTVIFVVNIYRDILNRMYSEKEVYIITKMAIGLLAPNKTSEKQYFQKYLDTIKLYNDTLEYYKHLPEYNSLDVVTKIYLSMVIYGKDFTRKDLDFSLSQTSAYKVVYDYINHNILENN